MSLQLAFKLLKRDWRGNDLRILAFALMLALGAISSVCFLSARVRTAFSQEAAALLGADLIHSSVEPIDAAPLIEKAHQKGLKISQEILMNSMVGTGEELTLMSVRGIGDASPLHGHLIGRPLPHTPLTSGNILTSIPPGTVWVDADFAEKHRLKAGDSVELGNRTFPVSAIIGREPSRLSMAHQLGSKLLIKMSDLNQTGLIDPNSRILYLLCMSGPKKAIQSMHDELEPNLPLTQRLRTQENIQPEARSVIDKLDRFFVVVGLVATVLACVAIALCCRQFIIRHADNAAILRALGVTSSKLYIIYGYIFLMLGVISAGLGCTLGWITQAIAASTLERWLGFKLPPLSIWLSVAIIGIGIAWLLALSLPAIRRLAHMSIIRVMRPTNEIPASAGWAGYAIALILWAVLTWYQLQDWKLTLYFTLALAASVLVIGGAAWLLLRVCSRPLSSFGGLSSRLIYRGMRKKTTSSVVQVGSLAIGLTLLALLLLIRTDLLHTWDATLSDKSPTHFISNIFPEQISTIRQAFEAHGLSMPVAYPMLRTYLIEKNGMPLQADPDALAEHGKPRSSLAPFEHPYGETHNQPLLSANNAPNPNPKVSDSNPVSANQYDIEAKHLLRRGFFITWTSLLPTENEVIKGRWIAVSPTNKRVFSLEADFAKRLHLNVGDELTFMTGETQFRGVVGSIRKLDWTSLNVNFYVTSTPGALDSLQHTMVLSFHLPDNHKDMIAELVESHPNIVVYPLKELLGQLKSLINKAALAVQLIFWWTLLIGLLVVFATRFSTQTDWLQQLGTMRIIGASNKLIRQFCIRQALFIGLLAAAIALIAVTIAGIIIGEVLFNRPIFPGVASIIGIPVIGIGLMLIAGWSLSSQALKQSTAQLIRVPD